MTTPLDVCLKNLSDEEEAAAVHPGDLALVFTLYSDLPSNVDVTQLLRDFQANRPDS